MTPSQCRTIFLFLSTLSYYYQPIFGQLDFLSGFKQLIQGSHGNGLVQQLFQQHGPGQILGQGQGVFQQLFKSSESNAIVGPNQISSKQEACFPYIGELAKLFWGNCKQQADTRTWLTWSKTIQDAFDSGKITLDNAVKETCRLTAEKETCETMGQRLAVCDVFGVIQVAIHMSQNQQRCEKIKGFIFQPQQNPLQNAGEFVGNEIVGGFVRRFLFGQ